MGNRGALTWGDGDNCLDVFANGLSTELDD